MPNFKSVIQHFCLPTSGRPLIREIAKGLKLGENEVRVSKKTDKLIKPRKPEKKITKKPELTD